MNQQSTIRGAADYELEVRELEEQCTAAMRMLLQLSRRLQEPAAAGFVEQCVQVKTVIADLRRMARDFQTMVSYGGAVRRRPRRDARSGEGGARGSRGGEREAE